MWFTLNNDFQERLARFNQTATAYGERMSELFSAGVKSYERRGLRAGSACGERAFRELFELSESRNLNSMRSAHLRSLGDCSDACMEEVRNAEQVALLTQQELVWWWQELLHHWSELLDCGEACRHV